MMKYSKQREIILNTLQKNVIHPTADQVYALLHKEYPTISLATVYRNLNKLAEANKIIKVQIPNGADRFDHQCFDHYHVVCDKCKKVFDVEMPYLKDLETKIKDKKGFTFTGHNIVFNGICPNCENLN